MAKLLIVDDIKDNVKLLSYDLQDMGYEVLVAYSGQEALAIAESERPDCILLDVMMPVMDGYDATRQLRKAGYQKPIAALTAHAMSSDQERCMAAGCDHYMTKPFKGEGLLSLVRDAIGAQEDPIDSPVPPHHPTAS